MRVRTGCSPDAQRGRYVVTDSVAAGPALYDVLRLDQVGGFGVTDSEPLVMLGKRAAAMGLRTATLDEVLCTKKDDRGLSSPPERGHAKGDIPLASIVGGFAR